MWMADFVCLSDKTTEKVAKGPRSVFVRIGHCIGRKMHPLSRPFCPFVTNGNRSNVLLGTVCWTD